MTAIKEQCIFEQLAEVFEGFSLFRCFLDISRDFHTRARGKSIQCIFEIKVLALHHKLEDIAALIALTETTPRPRFRPDHKRRRFLVFMERAKACVVLASMAQLYTRLRDEVYN